MPRRVQGHGKMVMGSFKLRNLVLAMVAMMA